MKRAKDPAGELNGNDAARLSRAFKSMRENPVAYRAAPYAEGPHGCR